MAQPKVSRRKSPSTQPGVWTLQDAKARLSDVVRHARTEGPQHVTVHGKQAAVILSEDEFRRLKGGLTGMALVDVFRACPHGDLNFELDSIHSPVRDVIL
jgi:prevent-host-death family protein